MPVPFILWGAAALAAAYGVKKGFDAKSDFDTAQRVNKNAQEIYDKAQRKLENARKCAQNSMTSLGEIKFHIYKDSLIPFVEYYSKIKNIDFDDGILLTDKGLPKISKDEMMKMKEMVLEIKEVVGGGLAALGAGGLAGMAAYGGVGALATASTGTAIGTLSGVAATNATLAWIGGGSLAAGGYGVAGGTMILGGIVAAPVLAVGGMMLASKAEAAKHEACANYDKARIAVEEMKSATELTNAIQRRFDEVHDVLNRLNLRFKPSLASLVSIVSRSADRLARINVGALVVVELVSFALGTSWIGLAMILFIGLIISKLVKIDYRKLAPAEKRQLHDMFSMAQTLKKIMEAPLIDQNGILTPDSEKIIESGEDTLKSLVVNPPRTLTHQPTP